jgi:hypothetical protein
MEHQYVAIHCGAKQFRKSDAKHADNCPEEARTAKRPNVELRG